jgi:hypothetical protein
MDGRRGRYCESGVDESTSESNTRPGLMFYELNSWDWQGSTPWKRDEVGDPSNTWSGGINVLATIQRLATPDVSLVNDHGTSSSATRFARQLGLVDKLLPAG